MRKYQLVLILKSSLNEADRKKLVETIKGLLGDFKFEKEDAWGEKALSYSIKREKSGFYYVLALEGKSMPIDFEKKLVDNDNVIRHLLIRKK